MNAFIYSSPIGCLRVEDDGEALVGVSLVAECAEAQPPQTDFQKQIAKAFDDYFSGKIQTFALPFRLRGMAFECAVWQALRTIPYSETRTYAQIAAAIGRPKACRAVGGACHRNPLLLVVPCHRVVGANGALTGFACGIETKRFLLALEQQKSEIV